MKTAWVEIDTAGEPIRIFKSWVAASLSQCNVKEMSYAEAVGEIRHRLFVLSEGDCDLCGSPVTESAAQMHEMKHRGKGGEISLENSVMICAKCHQNAHKERNPRWKQTGTEKSAE